MKHLIPLVFLLIACSPAANTSLQTELQNSRPAWLSAKPSQNLYYIGIGRSVKDGTNNHIQAAKKSALEDLVSEIKVSVNSTSVLSQIDANKEFQERYEQIIQTSAADEIEEFEQVDTWEDDRTYWVYYRLSKQRYKEIKDQQKRDAVTLALDFFTKAKQSERGGDLVQALGFYFQGFHAIEKYLADPITVLFEEKEVLLTTEIYANIQQLLDKIQITASPSEITVNRRLAQSEQTFSVRANLKESNKKAVTGLPLRAAFEKGSGDVFPDYKTSADGSCKILISKIGARDLEQTVGVRVNLMAFAGGSPTDIYSLVTQKLVVPKTSFLLKVQRPLVFMSAAEKSLGTDKSNRQISNRVKSFLTNAGFEFVNDKSKAELLVEIDADSEKGAVSGSIYIAYATAVVKVMAAKDNTVIYATTLDRVKGYSLDYERSSQEAYNKALDQLEKERLPELLNAILQ